MSRIDLIQKVEALDVNLLSALLDWTDEDLLMILFL